MKDIRIPSLQKANSRISKFSHIPGKDTMKTTSPKATTMKLVNTVVFDTKYCLTKPLTDYLVKAKARYAPVK